MKAVILAGGLGTRLMEETAIRPKPMVEIGGMPILWHIMKFYSSYGVKEFIICAGYKQEVIKEFFFHYQFNTSDITFDLASGDITHHTRGGMDWKVTIVNTGADTMTGGRLKRIKPYVGDEPFFMTYGDGLCDVNLHALLAFHKKNNKLVTLTAVHMPARFGELEIENNQINRFMEKQAQSGKRVNGGYMVMEPKFLDYIEGDHISLEQEPLRQAASEGQLMAFPHDGFWQCMDNIREKEMLEAIWKSGEAPWAVSAADNDNRKKVA